MSEFRKHSVPSGIACEQQSHSLFPTPHSLLFLIAFCALLILSGCDTPGGFDDPQEGYGLITVSIEDEFARTIYPATFARKDYFFAKVINGKTQNFEKQVPVEGVFTSNSKFEKKMIT